MDVRRRVSHPAVLRESESKIDEKHVHGLHAPTFCDSWVLYKVLTGGISTYLSTYFVSLPTSQEIR